MESDEKVAMRNPIEMVAPALMPDRWQTNRYGRNKLIGDFCCERAIAQTKPTTGMNGGWMSKK
jgi:hypothetical protein